MKLNLKVISQPRRLLAGVALTAAGLFAGCSAKPPGCADPETLQTLREVLTSQVQTLHGTPDGLVELYFKTHKLGIEMVTTDGYDTNAKRHACQATLTISDGNGSAGIRYAVQAIEGQGGQYLVKTFGGSEQFARAVWTYVESFGSQEEERARVQAMQDAQAAQAAEEAVPGGSKRVTAADIAASAPATVPTAWNRDPEDAAPRGAPSPTPSNALVLAPEPTPVTSPQTTAAASPSTTPSFSCTAMLSPSEQLICSSPALADADAKLGQLYSQVAAKTDDLAGLKKQQREWIKSRDTCTNAACMQASYANRSDELSR